MSITISPTTNSNSFGIWNQRFNMMAAMFTSNVVTADATSNGSLTTGNVQVNGYLSTVLTATTTLRGGTVNVAALMTVASNTVFAPVTANLVSVAANSTVSLFNYSVNTATLTANLHTVVGANLFLNTTGVTVNAAFTVKGVSNVVGNTLVSVTATTPVLNIVGNTTVQTVSLSSSNVAVTSNVTVDGTTMNVSSNVSFTGSVSVNSVAYSNVCVDSSKTVVTTGTSPVSVDTFSSLTIRGAEYLVTITDGTANHQITKVLIMHDGATPEYTEYARIYNSSLLGFFTADLNTSNNTVDLLFTPTANNLTVKLKRQGMLI